MQLSLATDRETVYEPKHNYLVFTYHNCTVAVALELLSKVATPVECNVHCVCEL